MQVESQVNVCVLAVWAQGYDFEISLILAPTDTSFSQKLIDEIQWLTMKSNVLLLVCIVETFKSSRDGVNE